MDPILFLGSLAFLYGVLFFFDRFFKSCMHYPYAAFLKNTGLSVNFLRIRWHTTAFNRVILRWGTGGAFPRFLSKTYTIGVFVALCLLPISIILIFCTIFDNPDGGKKEVLNRKNTNENPIDLKLDILLPGLNLPLDEVGFYAITFLVSTIMHECGHAFAAILEDVPITGFGIQIYFCIPLAFTEFSMEHLNALKWFRKLRILCAGVWHNIILATMCYLLLSSIGFFTGPLFSFGKDVVVSDITSNSPLSSNDDRGIAVSNIITHVNDCKVYSEESWYKCLLKALRSKPGYCVSSDFIRLNDESVEMSHHEIDGTLRCCDERNHKVCCFEYIDDLSNDAPVEIPQHVCLDIRLTIEESYGYCENGNCDRGFCLRPLLKNVSSIINIKRLSSDRKKKLRDIVYVGHPSDVSRTIRISPFVPKQNFITSNIADAYFLFLKYVVVFNIGLAIINIIPCFWLDGYYIQSTIINSFLSNRVHDRRKRDVITLLVTIFGTILFFFAILKVLWQSVTHFLK